MTGSPSKQTGFPRRRRDAVLIIIFTLGVALGLPLLYRWGYRDLAQALNQEDSLYELSGAVSVLAAAVLFLVAFWNRSPTTNEPESPAGRNPLFLVLGLGLLMMFGEEISWGQRAIGFGTPAWLEKANLQHEFNLHNLRLFHPRLTENRLKLAWMLLSTFYLGVLPWLAWQVRPIGRLARGWRVPLAPLGVAVASLATLAVYAYYTIVSVAQGDLATGHGVGESAETAIELLYLMLAVDVCLELRPKWSREAKRRLNVTVAVVVIPAALLLIRGAVVQHQRRDKALSGVETARRLIAAGQFRRAEQAALGAARCLPEAPEPRFYLGVARLEQGRLDAAAADFEKALELEPTAVAACRNLAEIRLQQGRTDEAIELLRHVAKLAGDAASRNRLGIVLLEQGRAKEAATEFRQALRLDPENQAAAINLERAKRGRSR